MIKNHTGFFTSGIRTIAVNAMVMMTVSQMIIIQFILHYSFFFFIHLSIGLPMRNLFLRPFTAGV